MAIILTAVQYGAVAANHTEVVDLLKDSEGRVNGCKMRDVITGREWETKAKVSINLLTLSIFALFLKLTRYLSSSRVLSTLLDPFLTAFVNLMSPLLKTSSLPLPEFTLLFPTTTLPPKSVSLIPLLPMVVSSSSFLGKETPSPVPPTLLLLSNNTQSPRRRKSNSFSTKSEITSPLIFEFVEETSSLLGLD